MSPKKEKMKKYAVTYQKTKILVPYPRNPRRGVCQVCGTCLANHKITHRGLCPRSRKP